MFLTAWNMTVSLGGGLDTLGGIPTKTCLDKTLSPTKTMYNTAHLWS